MKIIFFVIILTGFLYACSGDDTRIDNPNLLDLDVNFRVDLSLPKYNGLNFPSNPVFEPNYGNGGIYIMNVGTDAYVAFDAADPNHPRDNNCVTMERDGIQLICNCEENTYELTTGNFIEGDDLRYTLFPYRVTNLSSGMLQVSRN